MKSARFLYRGIITKHTKVCITNQGKHNGSGLAGETLKFPTAAEKAQGLLKRIGVDGIRYGAFFMIGFDGDVPGRHDNLGEHESIWPACPPSWIKEV